MAAELIFNECLKSLSILVQMNKKNMKLFSTFVLTALKFFAKVVKKYEMTNNNIFKIVDILRENFDGNKVRSLLDL